MLLYPVYSLVFAPCALRLWQGRKGSFAVEDGIFVFPAKHPWYRRSISPASETSGCAAETSRSGASQPGRSVLTYHILHASHSHPTRLPAKLTETQLNPSSPSSRRPCLPSRAFCSPLLRWSAPTLTKGSLSWVFTGFSGMDIPRVLHMGGLSIPSQRAPWRNGIPQSTHSGVADQSIRQHQSPNVPGPPGFLADRGWLQQTSS